MEVLQAVGSPNPFSIVDFSTFCQKYTFAQFAAPPAQLIIVWLTSFPCFDQTIKASFHGPGSRPPLKALFSFLLPPKPNTMPNPSGRMTLLAVSRAA